MPRRTNFRFTDSKIRARAVAAVLFAAFFLSCAGFPFFRGNPAAAQSRRFNLSDIPRIVGVSDAQISPNGKSIAFVVSRANMETDEHDRQLMLIDVATGAQRPLTYDRKGVGSPRWSPTGDHLAFTALFRTGKENQQQVFVLPMDGGGEAGKITEAANGIEQFAWSPDGKQIAYVTADDAPNKKEIEKHNDAFEVGDDDFLTTGAPTPSHLWLISAQGGAAKRLTSGDWSLPKSAPPSPPASPISWSPDGKWITFVKQATPHYGDSDLATVQILNVETGEIHKLTQHEKFEGFSEFSPDGSQIAYWFPRDNDPNNENEIYVTPAVGGDGTDVTRAIDHNIARAIWMPGGKSLLVGGHDGTGLSLWIQPLSGPAKQLALGEVIPSWLFWVDISMSKEGALAFPGSTPGRPSEIYYMSSADAAPRRLTDFNHEVASLSLGKMERITWNGPNGFHEDGVLVYPPDFSKDKKYPLVLYIHGGPTASSALTFSTLPQYIASHDYVVFSPNYRGSDNLGNAYQRAVFNDAGDGPGRDVMAGIEAVKKMGFVDTSKMAVTGWSYGGYMTSWMIGHYQIWKAAVSGAAVNDLTHAYTLSDFNVTQRYNIGNGPLGSGSPWTGNNLQTYRDQSPLTYAQQIKTPTLILSDTADARVPITQSYQMFHALKDNGVTVKFFAYPVPGHFPSDAVRTMDVYRRWVDWLDQYLK
ncbi:MAG: S9 family peptidase [Candidatus Acidiferrales bacterium]